ncbi:MAG: Rrf2 family transcriptional regulator [Rikenellaceae bacterium]
MLLTPTKLAIVVCTHLVPYYEQGRRLSVPDMEEQFKINPRTLNPALRILVHAGILNSRTGGSDRGYILARDPKDVSIYEIIQLIQGEPKVNCLMNEGGCINCNVGKSKNGHCLVFNALNRVLEMTRTEIGKISLYDQYYNHQEI